MKTIKVLSNIDGQPTFDKPLSELLGEAVPGSIIQLLTPEEYISVQQRKWFKGVLLPALAKDSGDSVEYWETTLKLAVMPDEFIPYYIPIGKQIFPIIMKMMNIDRTMILNFDMSLRFLL